jgi:hypothetical protein
MTEEATQPTAPEAPVSTETSSEPQTLQDVYKQFNVEETAREFQPASPTAPAPNQAMPTMPNQPVQPMMQVPDPVLDPQGHRAWAAQNVQESQNLRTALQQVAGKLNQFERARAVEKEEADIKRAVDSVNQGLDSKLDPDVVEIALGVKARKDPNFMRLWQSRNQKPEALNAALKVIAKELGTKYAMKSDPQIAENVRALKEATSGKATPDKQAPSSMHEAMQKATGAEFDKLWKQALGRTA